jgi:hypothetical protein
MGLSFKNKEPPTAKFMTFNSSTRVLHGAGRLRKIENEQSNQAN